MLRISFLTCLLLVTAGLIHARQKAAAGAGTVVALDKSMKNNLNEIASRFMEKTDLKSLVELTSPKSRLLDEIDQLQKEIISECNVETSNFQEFLALKQEALQQNQNELESQQQRLNGDQAEVNFIQGQIASTQSDIDELNEQLSDAQGTLANYNQQLQEATVLRQKQHDDNEAIIQQHISALADLQGLRDLVSALNVESEELVSVQDKVDKIKAKFANNLHKKSAAKKVLTMIDTVKATLVSMKDEDPDVKKAIKAKILAMIDSVITGVQNSLALYQQQETDMQAKFDNEIVPGLQALIQGAQDHVTSIQQQIGSDQSGIDDLEGDLNEAESDMEDAQAQVTNLQAMIATLNEQIQDALSTHGDKQGQCKYDLDALEQIRQYIATHVAGATPGNNCHPGAPDCPRCLYDDHCPQGQTCNDDATCSPIPPPQIETDYYQLIPDLVETQEGRRVDVGVIPQEALRLGDYAYVFNIRQLDNAYGWNNIFNVLNVGDNFPFPNQAALFLVGDRFEIDVCDGSKSWWDSYYYRNFISSRQPEIGQWNKMALVVSGTQRRVDFYLQNSQGVIQSQTYADYHGNVQTFPVDMGVWVNGRGYAPLPAEFHDFRRYNRYLSNDEVTAIFANM